MAIHIEVSIGEFLDKLAILEIKDQRIQDATKLANVRRELQALRAAWTASPHAATDIRADYASLKAINERLWEIEDRIRAKAAFVFGAIEFDHLLIKRALIGGVEIRQSVGDLAIYILNRLEHALANVGSLVVVSKFDCFMLSS